MNIATVIQAQAPTTCTRCITLERPDPSIKKDEIYMRFDDEHGLHHRWCMRCKKEDAQIRGVTI